MSNKISCFFFWEEENRNLSTDFFDLIYRNLDSWKPVTKFWVGAELYIVTTRPTDVEKILTNCLTKSPFYDNLGGVIKDSLLTLKGTRIFLPYSEKF